MNDSKDLIQKSHLPPGKPQDIVQMTLQSRHAPWRRNFA